MIEQNGVSLRQDNTRLSILSNSSFFTFLKKTYFDPEKKLHLNPSNASFGKPSFLCFNNTIKRNKKDQNMLEISIKIDAKNNVSINQNGEHISFNTNQQEVEKDLIPKKPITERTYDTFMLQNMQFFRIGEIYATIDPENQMSTISRTKYYKDRSKVRAHAV